MTTPQALHSAKTPRWGTPEWIIELARQCLGGVIELDPCSEAAFNQFVCALKFFDENDDGLKRDWGGIGQTVFVNPPGGLVKQFWNKLTGHVANGTILKAFWVGFSVEQLCTLADEEFHPTDFSICILRKRLPFTRPDGKSGGSPSHGNYVCAMGVDKELFEKLFAEHGKVIHGRFSV